MRGHKVGEKSIVVIPTYAEKGNVRLRRTGYSKITFGIAVESFKMTLRLRRA